MFLSKNKIKQIFKAPRRGKILQRFKLSSVFTTFNLIHLIPYLLQRAASCYVIPCILYSWLEEFQISHHNIIKIKTSKI